MNLSQLKKKFKKKVHAINYARIYHPWELLKMKYLDHLEVRFPTNSYCIERENGIWKVYYKERGVVFDEKIFASEKEACEYFEKWVMSQIGA